MNIVVYCGANSGSDLGFEKNAEVLGKWIAENNHTLVYGGGNCGLMGIVANAALENNGKVVGVFPDVPVLYEQRHDHLTEIILTDTMAERKAKMIEMGDAFIALPGGIGTLDEITEVMALSRLQVIDKPCIFYDVNGYYRPVREMFEKMIDMGFYSRHDLDRILFSNQPDEIKRFLKQNNSFIK